AAHGYKEFDAEGLDLGRLETALRRLIGRHDMLRAIVRPDGQQQVLAQVPPYEIRVLDLGGRSPEEVAAGLEGVRREMSHQVLAADRWPLFEIRATRLDDVRLRLHFSIDILLVDAWSSRTLSRELTRLYLEPSAELAPLEMTFRDYVLAEIAFQGSELYKRSRDYWWQRLEELPPAPDLPMVKPLSAVEQPRFVRREATLDAGRWSRLKARAGQAGLTPSGLLLAAFSDVLAAWSKSRRFTVNLTLFNRLPLHPQVNDVLGDFTTLTLVAVDGSRPGSFELRSRALQEQLWEGLEHRHVGGIAVLRELARRQKKAPTALTPVVFTSTLFGDSSEGQVAEDSVGVSVKSVYGISQTPQVWLDHQVFEHAGVLGFNWDVVEELFPAGLMDDVFVAYCSLLERLAVEEDSWKEESQCLVPARQLALWREVNATAEPVPSGLLHEGFESWVRREPERVAVISAGRRLSYGELDLRAEALAVRLRELGALPNRLVAVVMEKGWEQVVAVLAVLKAGAAYLPVDAGLPKERIWHLLERGEVAVALTQPWLEERLDWPEEIVRLRVEGEAPAGPVAALCAVQGPEDLAYVIFTSGSTGQPKGVMIDHRGALNTVVDVNQRFRVGPQDRVLALSALNFDLSVYDVF
ncbi:MAG: AMP-binding protein, partial [Acidobacteria bacterium]|nr:AMP-binding protein [Acidobacteriota bacterium]